MHVLFKSCNRNFCQYLLSCVRAVCMSSEIGVKIDCPIIVRRFQFFSLGAGGLPFSLSPAPESLISSFNWLIMGISDISDACGS